MLIPPQAALALATVLTAAPPAPIPPPGGRETFALERMQWRRHEIALEAGQFLQATVHQRPSDREPGVDVVLRLVAPDGRVLAAYVDSSEGPAGLEPASILADEPGTYAIEVWGPGNLWTGGLYALETQAPRVADARDRRRLRAESLMAAGGLVMGPRAGANRHGPAGVTNAPVAKAAYSEAEALWRDLGEACWQAEAATCLGINLFWMGDPESLATLHRARDGWQECQDDYKLAETMLFVGRWSVMNGSLHDAIDSYALGLDVTDDPVVRSNLEVQLVKVYGQLGETDEALRYAASVLPLLRELGHAQGVAVTLLHMATAHYRRGELQQASDLALESLRRHREIDEPQGELATLLALADIYDALGEPDVALAYLDDVIERAVATGPTDKALARSRAAAILRRKGEPANARPLLEQAIALAAEGSGNRGELDGRLQLATILVESGDEAARVQVEAAVLLAERRGDRFAEAQARELAGRLALTAGDAAAARSAFRASLALRRAIADGVGEATSLWRLAQAEAAAGGLDTARAQLEEARGIVSARRDLLATPELRATWASTVRGVDESYVAVLMALHRLRPAEGWDARAFEASDSASARALLDELSDAAGGADQRSEQAAQVRSARGRLTVALDRQVRARAAGQPAEALAGITREVNELSGAYARAKGALRAADPRRSGRPEPLSLPAAQALLDDDTTLLEFCLGEEESVAWVVGRDRLHAYPIPGRPRIAAMVAALRRALEVPPEGGAPDPASAALRTLADAVLPSDRALLRGARLVVVADGALHHVPFAALPDADGRPLIARLEVTSAPSAAVAAWVRREAARRPRAPKAIAVLADPVYDAGDERLPGVHAEPAVDAVIARATRGFDFEGGRLPRLPFTRREALAIKALAPAGSTVALDFRASLDTALDPDLASYRYVHFAAHGLLNDARPELSGIVLSLVDRQGRPRPGLLTAPDVSSLRLDADLVVLSSCRSAAGREVRGEGLVGLTRAFMHAGAPRVVASLWPIDDFASSRLMTRLYREMLGPGGASPASALRAAQLEALRHHKWRAPYYWAGFQLQGEWR